ncbi:PucR family transcriptional regulator ligand-binding domain-containing protein [Allokutzneria sp. A3M-2-11 16]|uniref:PucR family transcriptional regulator n=1 Tax=Allokutzneria sp. A3M-2-11 16 TaxID=2962043 RepID=UPI0020B7E961|nr:PucR family transcriptional regulator [Allokutzneria sp. A3M-2-11 16]MCP3801536.1 PucR family transcriptional regulator ligand-binding domain-containing protein [Allokutzneria sp. A3M-2-11 16]
MRLRDLVEAADLHLALLTGSDQLDRPIRWIYTTDLRDPSRYLSGGELVLTGLVWRRSAEDSMAFVAALAAAGVTALAAGDAEFGAVPADLVEACREHGVPLLGVPVDVSFATITERVVLALAGERGEFDWHRRMVAAAVDGGGLAAVLELGAARLDAQCWVLSPSGRLIGGSAHTVLSSDRRRLLVQQFLHADRLPKTARERSGEPVSLLPSASRAGQRLASWFLVVEGDHEQWDPGASETAAELATLIALERSRREERQRLESRLAGPLLLSAMHGEVDASEVDARLGALGFARGEPLCVLAATTSGGGPGLAPVVLGELVHGAPARGFVAVAGQEALALLSADAEGLAAALEEIDEAVRTMEPGLGDARLVVGVSGLATVAGLRGAVEEARQARRLAEHRPGRAKVATAAELASHLLLLATVPDELRKSFRAKLLGPLLAYDAAHKGELVQTLRVFLDCAGSPTRSAAQLHVHVNTLRYRLSRIEELTGRDLGSFPDRVDLYLALELG